MPRLWGSALKAASAGLQRRACLPLPSRDCCCSVEALLMPNHILESQTSPNPYWSSRPGELYCEVGGEFSIGLSRPLSIVCSHMPGRFCTVWARKGQVSSRGRRDSVPLQGFVRRTKRNDRGLHRVSLEPSARSPLADRSHAQGGTLNLQIARDGRTTTDHSEQQTWVGQGSWHTAENIGGLSRGTAALHS